MPVNKNLSTILRELMKSKNLSGRQLAQEIGVNHRSVQEWLGKSARVPRDPNVLKKLANLFNVSVHYILFGEEDPKSMIGNFLEKSEIHTGLYEITVRKVQTKKDQK